MSVRLPEKSLREGSADWWSQRQRLCLQGMSVKGGERHLSLYIHLQLLPDLTFFASEANCVIQCQFLETQVFFLNQLYNWHIMHSDLYLSSNV